MSQIKHFVLYIFFKVSSRTVVCSLHFKECDYTWTPVRRKLKKNIVPSQFWWNKQDNPRSGKATKRTYEQGQSESSEVRELRENLPTAGTSKEKIPVFEEIYAETTLEDQVRELESRLEKGQQDLLKAKQEKVLLVKKLHLSKFGVERFGTDDRMFHYYTGFANFSHFNCLFSYLEASANSMQSMYYVASETISNAGKPRTMTLIDELFMYLCRIRINMQETDLSVRFNCSQSTVSRKLITWANFLYFVLGRIPIWLPKEEILRLMPDAFKENYKSTRVIIDCTEIFTQSSSSLVTSSILFSNYKSHSTYKSLVGISPHGALTFVSTLYTGNMSDVEITQLCGLLDLLEPSDSVMADKGFTISKLLEKRGATLNIPTFLREKEQFTTDEIVLNEQIASLRIHVERYIRRVKENTFFQSSVPITLAGSINQIWTVACILANFKGPLIKSK